MTTQIYGLTVDNETRCIHYHSFVDIVAIKFACCQKFYPCYQCHDACENHGIGRWEPTQFNEHAIMCGICKTTLSIHDYMTTQHCPTCQHLFNAGCQKHYHIYFNC